jgi:hypothetical protein
VNSRWLPLAFVLRCIKAGEGVTAITDRRTMPGHNQRDREESGMALRGIVKPASAGAIGFDIATAISKAEAQAYRAKGYAFCIRYVSRTDSSRARNQTHGTPDLSSSEAQAILDGGLALMVVQHVAGTGWTPSLPLGQDYGAKAAQFAGAADVPPGVNLWLDLEDIPPGTPANDIVHYCNAWFGEVAGAGYVAGVYVGFNVWLSPEQLFLNLKTRHYWRAAGNIPDIAHRGYQLFQHVLNPGKPDEFDKDVAMPDRLGGTALWLQPI